MTQQAANDVLRSRLTSLRGALTRNQERDQGVRAVDEALAEMDAIEKAWAVGATISNEDYAIQAETLRASVEAKVNAVKDSVAAISVTTQAELNGLMGTLDA